MLQVGEGRDAAGVGDIAVGKTVENGWTVTDSEAARHVVEADNSV